MNAQDELVADVEVHCEECGVLLKPDEPAYLMFSLGPTGYLCLACGDAQQGAGDGEEAGDGAT